MGNIAKTISYLRRNGILKTLRMSAQRLKEQRLERDYEDIRSRDAAGAFELKAQEDSVFDAPSFFSVIVPAYETREEHLRVLLDSLLIQSYGKFELIIADAGESSLVSQIVAEYDDDRVVYIKLEKNLGISGNTNEAVKRAKGDVLIFVDHDDFLEPDAFYYLARAFEEGAVMAYTDEDKYEALPEGGRYFCPNRKPDFDYDLLLSNNYISHLLAVKAQLVRSVGGLRSEYDGAQDYDLILRCAYAILSERGFFEGEDPSCKGLICHIPRVLYHWRVHEASTAENSGAKSYAYEAGRMALLSHLRDRGIEAQAEHTDHLGFYRVVYSGGDMAGLRFNIPSDLKPEQKDFRRLTAGIFQRKEVKAVVYRIVDRSGRVDDEVCPGIKWWDSGVMHRNAMPRELKEPTGRAYCVRRGGKGSIVVYMPDMVFRKR